MQNSSLQLQQTIQLNGNNVSCNGQGVTDIVPAGQYKNIDYILTDDCFITGGMLKSQTSNFGDYANFQVVDINNMLGYGANYVISQFLTNWYIGSDKEEQINEDFPYPAKIPAGLALRVVYYSTGTTDVQVCVNYRLHKAKN
jgi:hypothetical protein